jgi:hypothetical protein
VPLIKYPQSENHLELVVLARILAREHIGPSLDDLDTDACTTASLAMKYDMTKLNDGLISK